MAAFEVVRERLRLAVVQGIFLTDEERSCLDEELDGVLESIAQMATIESADNQLQQLGLMQEILATLCFKYHIELSEKQRQLVRRYDRWDDLELRTVSFEEIRKGHFP